MTSHEQAAFDAAWAVYADENDGDPELAARAIRAVLTAAAPHIAAAAYGQGRDDEAAGEPIPDWIRQLTDPGPPADA
jgi:hypothetical protein